MIYYISPTAQGNGSGSTWANSANISALSSIVAKASPGDTILLRADAGEYHVTKAINLYDGGSSDAPITIKGVDGAGNDMAAQFVGDRAETFSPSAEQGSEVFRINKGADNLILENMSFTDINSAIRVTGDVSNLTIAHMAADNVNRFFENYATGTGTATIDGLNISDVDVTGFAKGVIRLQYDTHNVVIDGVRGDSQFTDGANFAIGVSIDGTAHDIVIRNSEMGNVRDTTNAYYNGDGFATEAGAYNIRFENVRAYNNTDAGFDIKSQSTVLIDTVSEGNTRNYRFWSDVKTDGIVSKDPVYHGGIGSASNIWMLGGNDVELKNAVIDDDSSTAWLYDIYKSGGSLTLKNVIANIISKLAQINNPGSAIIGSAIVKSASAPAVDTEIATGIASFGIRSNNSKLMTGTSGSDLMTASSKTAYVFTGAGDDTLTASQSSKMLAGGSDNDSYIVNFANVSVSENADGGYDSVQTNLSAYSLSDNIEALSYTGVGSFTGFGNAGDNKMVGGIGDDTLSGKAGDDSLYGGRGDDRLKGGEGNDRIDGDMGNDTIDGDEGNDVITSGAGDDSVRGGEGNDRIDGGSGNDTLVGDHTQLSANLSAGKDNITGGDGDDVIYGDAVTILKGIAADDILYGENGHDVLFGDGLSASGRSIMGNDRLYGGAGNDRLYGDTKDVVAGVIGGTNWLSGGDGDDRLYSGAGRDVFSFSNGERGADIIAGFQTEGVSHDIIELVDYGVHFDDLSIRYSGGNAVIRLDDHQTITVLNVTHLDAGDFSFL